MRQSLLACALVLAIAPQLSACSKSKHAADPPSESDTSGDAHRDTSGDAHRDPSKELASTEAIAAVDISLQDAYGCLRQSSGAVLCWGRNAGGEVGDGTEVPDDPFSNVRLRPTLVKGEVGAGPLHTSLGMSWVVHPDGGVTAWGGHSMTIGSEFVHWNDLSPSKWNLPPVLQIGLGYDFYCVVTTDKLVRCAGSNTHGELGRGTVDAGNKKLAPALAVGPVEELVIIEHSACGLRSDGSVVCWGGAWGVDLGIDSSHDVQPGDVQPAGVQPAGVQPAGVQPAGVRPAQGGGAAPHPSVGELHKVDRTPVVLPLSKIVKLRGDYRRMCALDEAGSAWCWSAESQQLPGNPVPEPISICAKPLVELAVGPELCGVQSDGELCCEPSSYGEFDLARLRAAEHITVRSGMVCGIVDGRVRCAGGHGATESALFPEGP